MYLKQYQSFSFTFLRLNLLNDGVVIIYEGRHRKNKRESIRIIVYLNDVDISFFFYFYKYLNVSVVFSNNDHSLVNSVSDLTDGLVQF